MAWFKSELLVDAEIGKMPALNQFIRYEYMCMMYMYGLLQSAATAIPA
jgi:hypothetical protein